MATKRRFEAGFDIIMRDLRATFRRMEPSGVTIALGGVLSQQATRQIARIGWAIETQQPALMPIGAAIGFLRDGREYRFACVNYAYPLDNLRAAQRAVSLIYTVYDEYAVNGAGDGRAPQEEFERLFGGHRLALGDGTTGDAWHEVLHVAPTAGLAVVTASYRALAKQLHSDRTGGDDTAMVRLNRAYAEAQAVFGTT